MKYFWRTIKIIITIVVIVIIVSSAFIYHIHSDRADTFYLLDASLINPKYLSEVEDRLAKIDGHKVLRETPLVNAHRLKRGDGVIFAYRSFSEGEIQVIDDEHFEKITIWLPEFPSERVSYIDMSNRAQVIIVYTVGGSAWPESACSGYLNSEQLTIRRKDKQFVVTLEGNLYPIGMAIWSDWCTLKVIEKEFEATEIGHHELTTWLGNPGSHPNDETYR